MENNGEKPDVKVDITQEEWEAQQDPQIEAAVAFIMKKLGKK